MHFENFKDIRKCIQTRVNTDDRVRYFLQRLGIDVTQTGFFKVRAEENTPSCKINKNGGCHDYGSGEHYSDIVSLFYDGYHAFDSLPETMEWLCSELNIEWEV